MARAQIEADRLGSGAIEPEHLILGLLFDPFCGAARILTDLGFPLPRVWSAVDFALARRDRLIAGETGLASVTRIAMERAIAEARANHHRELNTGHLLLGILLDDTEPAGTVLASLGIQPEPVREQLLRLMAQHPTGETPATPPSWERLDVQQVRPEPPPQPPPTDPQPLQERQRRFWVRRPWYGALAQTIGALKRVIGVGEFRRSQGVEVMLVSIESYELGFIVTLQLESLNPMLLPVLQMDVADDQGSVFMGLPFGGLGGLLGRGWWWRECYLFDKPLSPDASSLSFRINAIGYELPVRSPSGIAETETLTGPWRFTVRLKKGRRVADARQQV